MIANPKNSMRSISTIKSVAKFNKYLESRMISAYLYRIESSHLTVKLTCSINKSLISNCLKNPIYRCLEYLSKIRNKKRKTVKKFKKLSIKMIKS